MIKFNVGDKVRLTAKFLRSTGQYTGDEGRRVWTVTGHAFSGRMVIVDQPLLDEYVNSAFTEAELAADPTLRFRRIAVGNLQRVGGSK